VPEPRTPHSRDEDQLDVDLVLLVDGQLDAERAAALEARASEDPEVARMVALVRAGRDRVHAAAAETEAPFELRRRVDTLTTQPRRRRRWRPLALVAGIGAIAAVALALLVAGGAPSTGDVLEAALRPPVAAVTPTGGPLLEEQVEGVHFPDYEEKFGWRAEGQREDDLDGRLVRTVTYRNDGERVRYSIVAGEALEEPEGEDLQAEGTRLRRIGGENAVTWLRGGHTCVMDGSGGVPLDTIAELAGWKAKGEIRF
jgi:anti-sigma factor RsiW